MSSLEILDAPCGLVGDQLSASPGFSYGRVSASVGTFLLRPGGVPSNSTGVNFGMHNGSLDLIATGTSTADTYELTIYQHDGAFASPTTIAVVTVTASTKESLVKDVDYTQVAPLTKNRQIAIEVTSGSANNIGVDLQLSGDVSV